MSLFLIKLTSKLSMRHNQQEAVSNVSTKLHFFRCTRRWKRIACVPQFVVMTENAGGQHNLCPGGEGKGK